MTVTKKPLKVARNVKKPPAKLHQPKLENDYPLDLTKLRRQLKVDEGVEYEVYLDHLGKPTFGIGHLIKKKDTEYGAGVGFAVTKQRVNEVFAKDCSVVLDDCVKLWPDFKKKPEEVKQILANMMFNLGRTRLKRFKRLHAALESAKYYDAAAEMKDSKWYRQVPVRAERLCKRMLKVAKKEN